MNSTDSYERLRQYTELEYILLGDLRELLQAPDKTDTSLWMLSTLDALLETMPIEFELKQSGGYLQEVVDEHPNWQPLVSRLEREHYDLCIRLSELRETVARAAPFISLAEQIDADLRDWMNQLAAHNRHEIRLIQTAVNLEVGVGD